MANPYTILREEGREWMDKVLHRGKTLMWWFSLSNLPSNLNTVYERTMAAQQLGYSVVVEANDQGLRFHYVKALPESKPWGFR